MKFLVRCFSLSSKIEGFVVRLELDLPLHKVLILILNFFFVSLKRRKKKGRKSRGCLVCVFKQSFSVFKQHVTHFNTLFHPHVFPQIFLNNNFLFLNTHTKWAQGLLLLCWICRERETGFRLCVYIQWP